MFSIGIVAVDVCVFVVFVHFIINSGFTVGAAQAFKGAEKVFKGFREEVPAAYP